jgi:hypothetical protein
VPREREYIFYTSMMQQPIVERREAYPANYQGCRHAKEEMQERESQRTTKTTTRRVFFSNLRDPRFVLHGGTLRQQTATAAASDTPGGSDRSSHEQQAKDLSAGAPNVNSLPLHNVLKRVTVQYSSL